MGGIAGALPLTLTGCLPPTDVARELQRADLFVSASRNESFGMAVAEATACGAPVLAFDAGEIRSFAAPSSRLLPTTTTDAAFTGQLVQALADRRASTSRPNLGTWDTAADQFVRACAMP